MNKAWCVQVVSYETGEVVKTLWYGAQRIADKAANGLDRQINTERFYTRVKHAATARNRANCAGAQNSLTPESGEST